MKTLVAYYSRTGNNKYLATRLARDLNADLVELVPRLGSFPVMILFALLGWSIGLKRSTVEVTAYTDVVVCGPLWMGKLCLPAQDFFRLLRRAGRRAHLLVSCGSTDAAKNDQFGYAKVLEELAQRFPSVLGTATALPIDLVIPEAQKGNPQAVMATRLSDQNFSGPLARRYEDFVAALVSGPAQ